MPIERGQIYYVKLGPVVGREMDGAKTRPVLVLSINDVNNKPLVVSVVPGTTAAGKATHFKNLVVVEPTTENGLKSQTIFICHQLRAIDHSRFTSPAVGMLSSSDLQRIEAAIKYNLGLP